MKTLLFESESLLQFDLIDATGRLEEDFTVSVMRVLTKLYPNLRILKFNPKVSNDGSIWKPDLALIDKLLGHWYVVEVEVMTYDLRKHVIPQVCGLRDGIYGQDAAQQLSRELGMPTDNTLNFLRNTPRDVLVVSNSYSDEWKGLLRAENVDYLAITEFGGAGTSMGFVVEGTLEPVTQSICYGQVNAVNQAIIIRQKVPFWRLNTYEIVDNTGRGLWDCVIANDNTVWLTKQRGIVMYRDLSYVQFLLDPTGTIRVIVPNA